jgi:hypothetical protein
LQFGKIEKLIIFVNILLKYFFGVIMKKLLVVLVTVFMTVSAFAEVDNSKNIENMNDILIQKNIDPSIAKDLMKSTQEQYQAFEVAYSQNQYYNLYAKSTPFVYEPKSGYLAIAKYQYITDEDPYGEILFSSNMGGEWMSMPVYEEGDKVPVFPSIAILNPTGSNNPADFLILYYAYTLDLTASQWIGGVLTIITPDETLSFEDPGPSANNPNGGQTWYQVKMISNPAKSSVAFSGSLSNNSDMGYPYGKYGFSSFNFNQFDFDVSHIPAQWDLDKFTPSPNPNSSSNGPIYIDSDDQGNLYAMVNNIFVNDEERMVGFSKSTDNGVTWSAFTKVPETKYHDFIYAQGGDPFSTFAMQGGYLPYQTNGFKVYGENQFSAIVRLNLNDGQTLFPQYVEFNYDNGEWTINKVADWTSSSTNIISNYTDDADVVHDYWTYNYRGNELQLAHALDGHLVAKFIDLTDEPVDLGGAFDVYYRTQEGDYLPTNLDTLYAADIFAVYKQIGTDTWSEPVRLTADGTFQKMTWIPSTVPSINEVPMIKSETRVATGYENYHDLFQQRMVLGSGNVYFENFDLENVNSVLDEVNDVTNSVVYPNPSAETVNIKYTLEQPARVTIMLYDANGNRIGMLQNQMMSAGEQETKFNVSNLSNGAYIYRLQIGNSIEAGKFQVVR